MENNISGLLSEINRAANLGTALNLSVLDMEQGAKDRLNSLWNKASRFLCDETVIITRCLHDSQGFQVRAIPITMIPVSDKYTESINRELTISLNKRGTITGVRPAWEMQEDVSKILANPTGVADTEQRREILKWLEDFRCFYNERNLNALNKIFSEDAIIITGSIIKKNKKNDSGIRIENQVKYTAQTKVEYINKMNRIFKNNSYINIEFDHISVIAHNAKPNIYGVTLHQKWRTSTYSDDGWLFLLWDFNDRDAPQIHIRTWQPEELVKKDGVFSLEDFHIP
ncbi:MAG: nuclear transport factor 2 family protein [Muribaculaceae bacterium]